MSQTKQAQQIATELVSKLQGITDEATIKDITLEAWKRLVGAAPDSNSLKRPRAEFRKVIETAFSSGSESKPGYYWTKEGKGKGGRYEHLALWYCTTAKEKWDVVGDTARTNYWVKLPKFSEENPIDKVEEQVVEQSMTNLVEAPVAESAKASVKDQTVAESAETPEASVKDHAEIGLEGMALEQLGLDKETQKSVVNLLEHYGMNLADFVRQACRVHAKTMEEKLEQKKDDLTNDPTEELLNVTQEKNGKTVRTKYFTHPGRAKNWSKEL